MNWLLSRLEFELFHLGDTSVTPLSLLIFIGTIILSMALGRGMRTLVIKVVAARNQGPDHEGLSYAIGRIGQYMVVVSGVLLGLDNIGVSIAALTAVGAVLSVGIGFGLQTIAQNFIAGVILLVERPVQRGDVIRVGDVVGRVIDIEMRATRVRTLDGVSVLLPNRKLIGDDVHNMHAPSSNNRLRVKVGVAYGSDTALVRKVLLDVATGHGQVLQKPAPTVFFSDFGESALDFQLAVWLDNAEKHPKVGSDLRFAIDAAFRREGIQIPFPQRDVHFISGSPPQGLG